MFIKFCTTKLFLNQEKYLSIHQFDFNFKLYTLYYLKVTLITPLMNLLMTNKFLEIQ
jgi:hypothetical protein